MQMSPAGSSQISDLLEERDLVRRVPHPTDRRARSIEPGAAAAPIVQMFLECFAEFHRLSAGMTPERLSAVVQIMRGMEVASAAPFSD